MPPLESPTAPAPLAKKTANLRQELTALKIDRTQRRSRSWFGVLIWTLAVVAFLAGAAGAGYWALRDRLFPLPVVKVDSVRVMTLGQAQTQLTATGYLESRWQAAVGAKAPGRIANIPVEEGDEVKAGDLLAELEHSDLDAMLASRQVDVAKAEAELAEADFNLEQAERDLVREQDIFQRNAGTKAMLERAETTRKAAEAVQRARQAAVDSAKSAVVEAEESVRNMFIYAPFDGTVVQKDAEKGESIMPGGMGASSGRGSVITLAKLDELEVDTDVKEDYLGLLRRGQPAQIVVDAAPDRRYRGRLREIMPMGDRTRGVVKVKVSVLDPDERLFPELSATVHFLPDDKEGEANQSLKKAVFVPEAAVQGTGDQQYVWQLQGTVVSKTPIVTRGEPNDGLVAVNSELAGGERLVVDPPPNLQNGAQVQLAE